MLIIAESKKTLSLSAIKTYISCSARNVLYHDLEGVMTEPNKTKLQAQAWKIKASLKMRHLIWKMASGI